MTRYTEIPHTHWQNGGTLYGGGGGGATGYGSATAVAGTSSYTGSVSASGTSGGIQYTISGIAQYYVTLKLNLTYVAGTTQIRVYKGTGTSGTQLGSVNVSFAGPVTMLLANAGSSTTPGSITVVVTTLPTAAALPAPATLLSVDSMGYSWVTYTLATSLYTQCGDPKDNYEFGFNGQMKTNEIAGVGNHNTALFGELDTRTGRRWNLDPKPITGLSHYSVFEDNPIMNADILLDSPNSVVGHIIGPTLILLGQPIKALKPVGALGSKPGSSVASATLSKALPQTFTGTVGKKMGTKIATKVGTNVIGRLLGRLVPYAGWALTAKDAYENRKEIKALLREQQKQNKAHEKDLLWHVR